MDDTFVGYYWSSTYNSSLQVWCLTISNGGIGITTRGRYLGLSVRAVKQSAVGYYSSTTLNNDTTNGRYWSCNVIYMSGSERGYYLVLSTNGGSISHIQTSIGLSVRIYKLLRHSQFKTSIVHTFGLLGTIATPL